MNVCIPMIDNKKDIGPAIFARRLGAELSNLGVNVVDRNEKHDILLAIIRDGNIGHSRDQGAKIIQRLDGIYHFLDINYEEKNQGIKDTFEEADFVIYQSDFSKKLVEGIFGSKKDHSIVYNGINPTFFNKGNSKNGKIFLTSSKWRPMKRLESIVQGFNYANIPDSELWVLGDVENSILMDRVKYFGEVPSSKTYDFYNNSDFLMHLSYGDNCPNSVVEALVGGLPVICTDNDGTKELVKNSGEIIHEKEYGFKPIYSWDIPKVPKEKVAEAIHNSLENRDKYEFPREDLYIENCARNYLNVFEKVLG